MDIMGVPQFKRFFRQAASLHIDKDDLRRILRLHQRQNLQTARAGGSRG
ncbi:MAG: hypothetical protein JWO49_2106 [Arthrobacter sp.]|nr:hypothetical protein [Arthrobacter sp.]